MFAIGDFARLGQVSVRMLRHYDAIGLLTPARVDPVTGYRGYQAVQLARLNRIIALKDLGFTLAHVRVLLDERIDVAELHGMLRLRRAELDAAIAVDRARLARVEARLHAIESEGRMPTDEIILKDIPATTVAEITARAASYAPEDIDAVVGPLYPTLERQMAGAG